MLYSLWKTPLYTHERMRMKKAKTSYYYANSFDSVESQERSQDPQGSSCITMLVYCGLKSYV